jgi:hypothetical protein
MAIMSPADFAKQYWNLQAYLFQPEPEVVPTYPLATGWRSLRADDYRLGSSNWGNLFWQDVAKRMGQSVTVRVKTVGGLTEDVVLTSGAAKSHFHYPFVGKGSPEQAQIAIQLTYRFHKTIFTPEQFVSKDFVGLDCNGFVGNYIQRVVKGQGWQQANNDADPGPTTGIGGLLDFQGPANQMTDIKDLRPADTYILGFCTPDGTVLDPDKQHPTRWGHVMITEPGTLAKMPNNVLVSVVEATASANRKLRVLLYTILSSRRQANGTVFKILRGTEPMDVRIARLRI